MYMYIYTYIHVLYTCIYIIIVYSITSLVMWIHSFKTSFLLPFYSFKMATGQLPVDSSSFDSLEMDTMDSTVDCTSRNRTIVQEGVCVCDVHKTYEC